MQEEVENKSVALSIKATKLTASVLKAALRKALAEMEKAKKNPKQYAESNLIAIHKPGTAAEKCCRVQFR